MTKAITMQAHQLTQLAKVLSEHKNWSLSTVAVYATNDGKFFDRLKRGGSCTLKTAARVVGWFDTNWPTDLEWPRDIPRPPKSKKEKAA
ncbi:hypothetical protein [Pararhodobacter sp.]|uniref:hypothetical protein n=1 Tax=Pararhodobacter sp. TaxID=2127056 RepID=UPI002FE1FD50